VKRPPPNSCDSAETISLHALHALAPDESAAAEAHIAACPQCQREWAGLVALVEQFGAWPTDVLCPPHDLQPALARRLSRDTTAAPPARSAGPDWLGVAPGIDCKLLATDLERQRVSMLVRLAPGASYPPHTHAGHEELHLLDGELWIDGRKLQPGDYNHGAPGTGDERVWSATGCTCVLITGIGDVLR
jgi:anti-sigma factor ChrR (cupin superfamily)